MSGVLLKSAPLFFVTGTVGRAKPNPHQWFAPADADAGKLMHIASQLDFAEKITGRQAVRMVISDAIGRAASRSHMPIMGRKRVSTGSSFGQKGREDTVKALRAQNGQYKKERKAP